MTRPFAHVLFFLLPVGTFFSFLFLPAVWATDSVAPVPKGQTFISGRVTAADDGPIAGVILIEKGRLYGKDFRYGGLIDKAGQFSVKVDQGGDYGIHIYATGYIYFPLGLKVLGGQKNFDTYKLPPNPAVSHAPVVSHIRFSDSGDSTTIRITVSDPDNDLSHQVLALNGTTGRAFILKPPKFVFPWTKNYPQGVYTLGLKSAGVPVNMALNPEDWYFVAADNRCYNSPLMKYPFDPGSFIEAHSLATPGPEAVDSGKVSGKEIFRDNCSVCHYPDTTKTKVGPGLRGLFNRKASPVQGFPINEANVANQIMRGGTVMPPYAHLTDAELKALIDYLKTL